MGRWTLCRWLRISRRQDHPVSLVRATRGGTRLGRHQGSRAPVAIATAFRNGDWLACLLSSHLDFNELLQARENIRAVVCASGNIGRRWTRVFLAEEKRCNPAALGQLIRHEEIVLWNVLQVRSRKEK